MITHPFSALRCVVGEPGDDLRFGRYAPAVRRASILSVSVRIVFELARREGSLVPGSIQIDFWGVEPINIGYAVA